MPRKPRVFVEGGIYHVYNRCVRGERLFNDVGIAGRFVTLVRRVRDRDDLTIFAWCVMPNHYHLAIRTGPVPLSRTMGYVQSQFGRDYNRRYDSNGPRWQARYRAKLVEDTRYLRQLALYIHVNPLAAGLVADLGEYTLSGHSELLGRVPAPLLDVAAGLSLFGDSVGEARRGYEKALVVASGRSWANEAPGQLPWWSSEPDQPIRPPSPKAWIDERGVSTGHQRPRLSAEVFLAEVCALLHIPMGCLVGPGRQPRVFRARLLVAGLAVERWGVPTKELAARLGRWPEVVSRWASRAGRLRLEDDGFRREFERTDAQLANWAGTSWQDQVETGVREIEDSVSMPQRLIIAAERTKSAR